MCEPGIPCASTGQPRSFVEIANPIESYESPVRFFGMSCELSISLPFDLGGHLPADIPSSFSLSWLHKPIENVKRKHGSHEVDEDTIKYYCKNTCYGEPETQVPKPLIFVP